MRRLAAGLATAAVLAACGGGGGGGGGGPSLTIAKAGAPNGDAQTAAANTPLADSLRVLVQEDGSAKAGVNVTWSTTGGGALSPATAQTNASGIASAAWTLGPVAGAQVAKATLAAATGSPVTFNATATGGQPAVEVTTGSNFFRSVHNATQNPAVDTAQVGQPVRWNVSGSHTVHSLGTPSFTSSGNLITGQSYVLVFNGAGTYQYDCAIHGSAMTGRIVVLP